MDHATPRIPLAIPRSFSSWQAEGGTAFTWVPSPATLIHIENAPIKDVMPSFQQEQHLRSFRSSHQNGSEMERLLILTWDMPGHCDLVAMSDAINTHLRRHDTYHSWYSFEVDNRITRRVIPDPCLIEYLVSSHGMMSRDQVHHQILATPNPEQWDCFRFGVIQRTDDFSFFASIDHLHSDAFLIPLVFRELYGVYKSLTTGKVIFELPETASYYDFCKRQRQEAKSLSLEDPGVQEWVTFLKNNNGTLPRFPLKLGNTAISQQSCLKVKNLINEKEVHCFEKSCRASKASFFAGIIACMAIVENELLGTDLFHVITPTTTRKTLQESSTSGWYTGLVPLNVQISSLGFSKIARAVHVSFRKRRHLANIPFERVIELTRKLDGINIMDSGAMMVSYLDVNMPPLKHDLFGEFERMRGQPFLNTGVSKNIAFWITLSRNGIALSVSYPDNPDAAKSVEVYSESLRSVCLRVSQ